MYDSTSIIHPNTDHVKTQNGPILKNPVENSRSTPVKIAPKSAGQTPQNPAHPKTTETIYRHTITESKPPPPNPTQSRQSYPCKSAAIYNGRPAAVKTARHQQQHRRRAPTPIKYNEMSEERAEWNGGILPFTSFYFLFKRPSGIPAGIPKRYTGIPNPSNRYTDPY